jgi:hypothetical protein
MTTTSPTLRLRWPGEAVFERPGLVGVVDVELLEDRFESRLDLLGAGLACKGQAESGGRVQFGGLDAAKAEGL